MYVIVKIIVSAFVIAAVTELARKFPTYGGVVAALPLVSLLSIIWLSIQGEKHTNLSQFILGVLWGFPATAVLLVIVYFSLKSSFPLLLAILLGLSGWILFIWIQSFLVKILSQFLSAFS